MNMIDGIQIEGVSEQALAELMALYGRDGALTTAGVLEWAQAHPDSALHREFEWDDQQAATQYRLHQARQLIAKVNLRLISDPTKVTRAFVSVQSGDTRSYVLATQAISDEVVRAQQIRNLTAQIGKLMDKLSRFEEFAEVVVALGQVKLPA